MLNLCACRSHAMRCKRAGWTVSSWSPLVLLVVVLVPALVVVPAPVTGQTPKNHKPISAAPWLTLSGKAPSVIANGGFSGLFPDSSPFAYKFTYVSGTADTISLCDVRLTKDGIGICLPDILLDNCTNVQVVYPDGRRTYTVNGVATTGWFSVDYDMMNLSQISLMQGVLSRTDKFDASVFPVLTVDDVVKELVSARLWLNIQHDMFYKQQNLSMTSYLLSLPKSVVIDYVSSPEVAFLTSLQGKFKRSKTRLIFRFLEKGTVEPTTNMTYGSLLGNLTFVKQFASGILVPKNYIWPLTSDLYLLPPTSVVTDAHKEGLEVYASDFANDGQLSYNYSYDPLPEILNFIDNGMFSVDGLLTDFPITASEGIGCFSHVKVNHTAEGKYTTEKPMVVSHNGASGMYPDCSDLAYQQAVVDGADYIDCPIQVTKDGILLCMSSIDLIKTTTVTQSSFSSHVSVIPELHDGPGIFTFNLTWEEIQKNLKPKISNPQLKYGMHRNPRYENAGNFMRLSDFLVFARDKEISGVLISIENAAFLAERLGYSIIDGAITTLKESGYDNQTNQEVIICSTNSSVLLKLKQQTKYKLMYVIDESIGDAVNTAITDIRGFAHYVALGKQSIYPVSQQFIVGQTDLVQMLHSADIEVFVYLLMNEFISQPWDCFSDPTVEINSYVQGAGVDGIITDYPRTAATYKRNTCLKLGDETPIYMKPIQVGGLLQIIDAQAQPPVLSPLPALQIADVVEPPLAPASLNSTILASGESSVPPTSQPSGGVQALAPVLPLFLLCGMLVMI